MRGTPAVAELTITCPKCRTEIPLTESLAAPLIEDTRQRYEVILSEKNRDIEQREESVREKERTLAEAKRSMDVLVAEQVAAQLKNERERIIAEEARKARQATATELDAGDRELQDLREVLGENNRKLTEAQKSQAEFLRKQRELDDARREVDLTVEKRVQEGLNAARLQARQEADERLRLKVAERDLTIASMQRTIDDLQRKADQGSQQLQGEVQELELESLLRAKFPYDTIEPVPKGEFGGDVWQRVFSPHGAMAGTILWESKRTKNWSNGWLPKMRDDQRVAKADISILVSQALPPEVDSFDVIDGVWVTHPHVLIPVATALRNTLLQISTVRLISEGQQTKAEMVYQYLTGPQFHQRVEAIVEAFSTMQDDLEKERRAITKQWAKRSEQIDHVMTATVGMYGDLQGIAGKSIQEIDGLEPKALSAGR